jgi:hypothetical protein
MDFIRRSLDARSRARRERQGELVSRLRFLIRALRDRLDSQSQRWATENLEQAECEIAIDALWGKVDAGTFALSPTERLELEALTNHPDVNRHMLSTPAALAARDIRRR